MRISIILYCLFLFSNSLAQAPTVLQWQKNYGGSLAENASDFKILPDGNFIMLGSSYSNDGDIAGNHGAANTSDVCVIKSDPGGNVLWKKSYGGTLHDNGSTIILTTDGGFIFVGSSTSNDGDVTGHHGSSLYADVWVVKLDASGNIVWQKSYGGSFGDHGSDILETSGGFIISGSTASTDGDISGHHGIFNNTDLWVLKIDFSGNLIWQKCYGGTKADDGGTINQTLDGAFLLTAITSSTDGDVSNPQTQSGLYYDSWILKISPAGAIIWDKSIGGNYGDIIGKVIVNSDGSYFLAGYSASTDLPGSFPRLVINGFACSDGWVVLLDAAGKTLWQKAFGGTNNDAVIDAIKTQDGGYLLVGETKSADGIVCQKHLLSDTWLVKMDNTGNIQWNRTYGGSKYETGMRLSLTSSGDCFVLSSSSSTDGDITNNKGSNDFWLARFSFTGVLIYPSVTISANTDSIRCTGSTVQFFAVPVNGGTNPTYQWKLNAVNIGTNNDTILVNNIYENDLVSCMLTSSSNCVDVHTVSSNTIKIKIGLLPPRGFLPKDTALCSYQKIELIPNSSRFVSYLWSDSSTTRSIKVKKPGLYWLEVTDQFQCTGRDSVIISPKTCIEGIYIPNAFTPNKDGRNDLFMPFMYADVKQFHFIVYDRWGRIVFETTTLNKGWNGKVKDMPYDTGVFIWQCIYQLEGEEPTSKRGTVLLMR